MPVTRAEWTASGACTSGSTARPGGVTRRASGGGATTSTTRAERGRGCRGAIPEPEISRGMASERASGGHREEAGQGVGRFIRNLFREEVTRVERTAADISGPGPPEPEGAAGLRIPGVQWSSAAPEREDRAGDAVPAPAVRLVVLAVAGRRGPVLFADGVRMSRIAQGVHVRRPHLGVEDRRQRAPAGERVVDDGFG